MKTITHIEELEKRAGEVQKARILVASLPDGTETFIPLLVGDGIEEGPTLLLTALIHGVEIGGYDVIKRLMLEEVNFQQLKGRIIAVPIVNPFALNVANRYTPQDSADLNRVFPGHPNGTISQRIANVLAERLVSEADFIIDYHSCNPPSEVFTIVLSEGEKKVQELSWGMAEAFGAITVAPTQDVPGTFSGYLASIGKPSITPELVFSRRFDQGSSDAGVIGTLNVMKYLGMINGEIQPRPHAQKYKGKYLYTACFANTGGFVYFNKKVGATFEKNEVFATVQDPWGEVIDEMRSPVSGMLIATPMAGNQAVATGDKVAYFASPPI
ncbi:succinylglutamate desuccinylase/aspartoacylase family protein [Sutcliffiella cohnii]|uniref:succinylglutamate desuccinylase/aspartoacylase family protein n=1 Tax=Sutcliffiella cohnii TaxID=33932 RepID=UPI002E1DE2CA|nr:succinylglutamate desuccinylase/aspartoacylase family protein [Sutcliffiella cohnii]